MRKVMRSVLIYAKPALLSLLLTVLAMSGQLLMAQDWPLFRGQPSLSGYSSQRISAPQQLSWRFTAERGTLTAPVVQGQQLFVASSKGDVFAIDIKTGKQLWHVTIDKARLLAAPTLVGDDLCLASEQGAVYVLRQRDGSERWRYTTQGKIIGPINSYRRQDGVMSLLVIASNDHLYALRQDDGRRLWTFRLETRIEVAPAVVDNNVIFGGCDSFVRVVDADSGLELANVETASYIPVSAAVQWPYVYVGNPEGQFLCLDPFEETILWIYQPREQQYRSSPAVGGGRIIVGSDDQRIHCLSLSGQVYWEFMTGDMVLSSPILIGDKVFVGSHDGFFYCLAAHNGQELWSYETGDAVDGSPAWARGHVFVSAGAAVYAFAVNELN